MSQFSVDLNKPENGWFKCKIYDEESEIEFCASYTPRDTFDDLVRSVKAIYENGTKQQVLIYEEPELWQLLLSKENEQLVIELLNNDRNSSGKLICNFQKGCKEFANSFESILKNTSKSEFTALWGHEPPTQQINSLSEYFVKQ